jgi:hypothetical protein
VYDDERHGRAQRVIAPDRPAIHVPLGLAKEDVDARAQMLFAARGHDDWDRVEVSYTAIRGRLIG